VAAWIGSANLGDELVFSALTAQLRDRGVAVEALSTAPEATAASHGVVGRRRLSAMTTSTDMTVLGGGGLLQDETSTLNLDLHLSPVIAARMRDEPLAGVGLGAGPLETRSGRARVRAILGPVPLAVRDAGSADVLTGLGLPRPVVAADLALSLPQPAVAAQDRVVVCLRPWSGHRHRLPARFRKHRPDDRFAAGAALALDALSESTGMPVHLVAFDAPKDVPLHIAVADRMRHTPTTAAPEVHEVVAEVAASRLVVSMRYHGGIAAVLAGRPSLLVGYSSKVGSLASELGRGAGSLPWSPEGPGDLVGAAEQVLDREDDVLEARARLVEREKGNGRVLDDLIERAARRHDRLKAQGEA
jgi:polysaccharide pyruvyl transferase CsaB